MFLYTKKTKMTAEEQAAADEQYIENLKQKAAKGEKLSNKERKALDKALEDQIKGPGPDWDEGGSTLGAFSITVPDGMVHASDEALTVEQFSISAPKQLLFDEAELKIVMGRRYGLLGPNGQGKTTLLKHIAAGAIPTPEKWDVEENLKNISGT